MSVLRGYKARLLKIDLAKGEETLERLGQKYGVSGPAVSKFKTANAEEIEDIKRQIAEGVRQEVVGLWVANKANRIAEYEKHLAILDEQIESDGLDATDVRGALKVAQQALRNVAEELGDLKVSVDVDGTVKYTVEGLNEEDLK